MKRGDFIKTMGLMAVVGTTGLANWLKAAQDLPEEDIWMPSLFLGHGSPMNALEENDFTRSLKKLGGSIPKPRAILCVSAHWLSRGTSITSTAKPPTIHDFYGFPDNLFAMDYPCVGSPAAAKATQELLHDYHASLDANRGLDHGVWSVLVHMFPEADIPVYQVSIDISTTPQMMVSIGNQLKEMRKRGVLIIGSGNIVHNLGQVDWGANPVTPDWAEEFDAKVAAFIDRRDAMGLANFQSWGNLTKMAHPSTDHFLPLLYSMGTLREEDKVQYAFEGFQHGSISMRCLQIG